MDIKNFYKFSQKQIVLILRDFIEKDFFEIYPQLKDKVTLIITGSVAHSLYDQYSDIDVEFLFYEEPHRKLIDKAVREYKKSLYERKIPIQFHPSKSFLDVKKIIENWNADDAIREYSRSLVVFDSDDRFLNFQRQLTWYPKSILQEKINWLYAETIFEFVEHYTVAIERGNLYYAETTKVRIINLLGNAMSLSDKKWSCFPKHLFANLAKLSGEYKDFVSVADLLVKTSDVKEVEQQLKVLIKMSEDLLIQKNLL